jgi:hypothetical protein
MIIENFQGTTAMTMFHEVYHYKDLVSRPRTDDFAYHATETYNLAKQEGTRVAYVNAESYAFDALAIYLQQRFNTKYPPAPEEWVYRYIPVKI